MLSFFSQESRAFRVTPCKGEKGGWGRQTQIPQREKGEETFPYPGQFPISISKGGGRGVGEKHQPRRGKKGDAVMLPGKEKKKKKFFFLEKRKEKQSEKRGDVGCLICGESGFCDNPFQKGKEKRGGMPSTSLSSPSRTGKKKRKEAMLCGGKRECSFIRRGGGERKRGGRKQA